MRVKTIRYRTKPRLEQFVKENYESDKEVFIQLFLPSSKKDLAIEISKNLTSILPDSKIISTTTNKVLLNSTISDDIVINFIDDIKIKTTFFTNYIDLSKELKSPNLYLLYTTSLDHENLLKETKTIKNLLASFGNDFLIFNNQIKEDGFILIEFLEELNFDIEVINHIEPLGRELKISKCEKNTLSKIDEFKPKLTKNCAQDIKKSSFTFPLLIDNKPAIIQKERGDDIELDFKLDNNAKVNIGFSNSSEFYKKYKEIIKRFDNKPSSFLFLLSSIGRQEFFLNNSFEFDSALGIFSNSELAVIDSKVYDDNLSIFVLNISNSPTTTLKVKRYKTKDKNRQNYQIDALANIAKVSSSELQSLNEKLQLRVKKEVEKNLKKDSILIHRSRLAQMGEMISLIAHQWKQPLSAISATSSGLQVKAELDMYDRDFFISSLQKIENFVNHLSTTIDDFSNFFKPSKQKKEFLLYSALQKAVNIASYSLTKNHINLEIDAKKDIYLKSFENELIQVLLNLIKNAENILVKREIKNPKIWLKSFKKDDKVYIQVIDNGGGVENSIKNKIFEPYFSTKATSDSTGLGLYMSKFIVENSLNGRLELKNEKSGANFSIILV